MVPKEDLLMATHRNFFPVTKMPWHNDDHKFGEGAIDYSLPNKIVPLPPPPIDATIALVDSGRCYVCGAFAVYLFKGKMYCSACWLAWDEDFGG